MQGVAELFPVVSYSEWVYTGTHNQGNQVSIS